MLQNFKSTNTIYYLLDVHENGGESYANPLSKVWNSSSFQITSNVSDAYKFDTKEQAIKAATLQNTLNEVFGSDNKVYVVQGTTNNTLFDIQGQTVQPDTIGVEVTES